MNIRPDYQTKRTALASTLYTPSSPNLSPVLKLNKIEAFKFQSISKTLKSSAKKKSTKKIVNNPSKGEISVGRARSMNRCKKAVNGFIIAKENKTTTAKKVNQLIVNRLIKNPKKVTLMQLDYCSDSC
ncbi:hypothetical protein N9Y92_01710 [Chlamydiales bacterium]|nr:hypothetical protein [Chlamydiales bacterium]